MIATQGKWIQASDEAKNQIMALPDWEQGILIEDITAAMQNRIIIKNNASKNIKGVKRYYSNESVQCLSLQT